MKKLLLTLMTLALLTACATALYPATAALQPTETAPVPTAEPPTVTPPPPTPYNENELMARGAALDALAQALGISLNDIKFISQDSVEWPDGCLGIVRPGLMCTQVITTGYRLMLEVNGQHYEYHTNTNGSTVLPASIALTWHREGGIAGFCDDLTILLTGEAYVSGCGFNATAISGALTADELAQLHAWVTTLDPTTVIQKDDPAIADAMSLVLTVNGVGGESVTNAAQRPMLDWAQAVFYRLTTAQQ